MSHAPGDSAAPGGPKRSQRRTSRQRRVSRPLIEVLEGRVMLDSTRPVPVHLEAAKPAKKPAITLSSLGQPDASGSVTILGTSYARAQVSLDLGADGSVE